MPSLARKMILKRFPALNYVYKISCIKLITTVSLNSQCKARSELIMSWRETVGRRGVIVTAGKENKLGAGAGGSALLQCSYFSGYSIIMLHTSAALEHCNERLLVLSSSQYTEQCSDKESTVSASARTLSHCSVV